MAMLTGDGTLYDRAERKLGPVHYRIEHDAAPGEPIAAWTGKLRGGAGFARAIGAGAYILILEDGGRGEIAIAIAPPGVAAGDGPVTFSGSGVVTAL